MKLFKTLVSILIVAVVTFSFSACEKASDESCEEQDMNQVLNCGTEKIVEVCCITGSACTYKYDGVEYPDTNAGLNDLADALGCNYKDSQTKEQQKELIIKYLIALKDKANSGV